jgi:hypothetical protein
MENYPTVIDVSEPRHQLINFAVHTTFCGLKFKLSIFYTLYTHELQLRSFGFNLSEYEAAFLRRNKLNYHFNALQSTIKPRGCMGKKRGYC